MCEDGLARSKHPLCCEVLARWSVRLERECCLFSRQMCRDYRSCFVQSDVGSLIVVHDGVYVFQLFSRSILI